MFYAKFVWYVFIQSLANLVMFVTWPCQFIELNWIYWKNIAYSRTLYDFAYNRKENFDEDFESGSLKYTAAIPDPGLVEVSFSNIRI